MIKQDTIPSNNQFSVEVVNDGSLSNLRFQSMPCETCLCCAPSVGAPSALVSWAHWQRALSSSKSRWSATRTWARPSIYLSLPNHKKRPHTHGRRPRQDQKDSQSVMQKEAWSKSSLGRYDWYEQVYTEGSSLIFIIESDSWEWKSLRFCRCRSESCLATYWLYEPGSLNFTEPYSSHLGEWNLFLALVYLQGSDGGLGGRTDYNNYR